MSTDPTPDRQQKVTEFMRLLPLTLAVAGLPEGEHGKPFNESQMESRAMTLRTAYKVARQIVIEIAK